MREVLHRSLDRGRAWARTAGASTCCWTRSASSRRSSTSAFGDAVGRLAAAAADRGGGAAWKSPTSWSSTSRPTISTSPTSTRWSAGSPSSSQVPMLIVSHDREILDRVTERTLFLRSDGMHAFKTRFSQAREELLRRDAAAAARASAGGQGDPAGWSRRRRATRSGRSRTPTSTSARTPSRRASPASRPSARRPMSRASGGWSSATATSMRAVALRIAGLDVKAPGRQRKLIAIDRLTIAAGDRVALLGANGAGKSTLLVDARRRLRSGTASTMTARRRCASIRPAGWSISTRPCATCRSRRRSSTTSCTAEGVERAGRHPLARAGGLRLRPHRRADRRAEPRRARARWCS